MHGIKIAEQIIEEAKRHGKPIAISVELGSLAPMTEEELISLLKTFVDWKINILSKKGVVSCKCGYYGGPKIVERGHDFLILECPECRSQDVKIISGNKIILKSVEV